MNMRAGRRSIGATAVAALWLISCSKKPDYYQYDGGMINLGQVRQIDTTANIALRVTPRIGPGEEDSYERAIYGAHLEFCNRWKPNATYTGAIPRATDGLLEIRNAVAVTVTHEVLRTCKVEVLADAIIQLDNTRISQESGVYELPVITEAEVSASRLGGYVSGLIASSVKEPLMWNATFRSLQSRLSFD